MRGRILLVVAVGLFGCRDKVNPSRYDAGLACGEHEKLVEGECRFVCERDTDCGAEQRCNLFTGKCEAKPPAPDASVVTFPCTTGAVRCRGDNKGIETCSASGEWQTTQLCQAGGFCLNEQCLACQPGAATCDPANNKQVTVCKDDGSATRAITCAGAGVCFQGECRECGPNTRRCSADGKSVQVCGRTADETLTWKWQNAGDAFDGSCITQACETPAGMPARCKPAVCFPGTTQCKSPTEQNVCSDTGAWVAQACSSLPGFSSAAECAAGACIDECADAVRAKSYFGCEYWSAIPDNSVDVFFKGGATSGQGTNDSSFAFVVTNRSQREAQVKVFRQSGGTEVLLKTVTVEGRDGASKGLAVIKVPWQSIGAANATVGLGVAGKQPYGYRLVSTRPITVYQFSPLDADVETTKTCSGDFSCTDVQGAKCVAGKCHNFTYSNDASLLLPAHILGTSYVVVSADHVISRSILGTQNIGNSQVTIVATQNGTTLKFKSTTKTAAGTGAPSIARGSTGTFTLNAYDVLQITTDNDGADLECSSLPAWCRVDSDLTGSVITSDKPVAVFGGAACNQTPFDKSACDHIEEMIFPFNTWGKTFVAQQSHPLRLTSGGFASPSAAAPDYWKIVAACPATTCPNGTLITLSAPPTAGDVLKPDRCLPGTSLTTNNCRLAGGTAAFFRSKSSFTVVADQPIAVAQFFAGQEATTSAATQGDPSLVLLPPAEQWRNTYTVLAAPGIKDNYLGLSIDDSKVSSVLVDGAAVPGFTTVAGTNYRVVNHPVSVGTHTIQVIARPGQTQLPGAGVTIYGFDSYVSYGYTGGLDLTSIVTGVDPGG